MRKLMPTLMICMILATSPVLVPALAKKGKSDQSGKSNIAQLYLYEKDPSSWEIVEDGAWGKMTYRLKGKEFWFRFEGHGLEAGVSYSLIYYPDPYPGIGGVCFASGEADDFGNVKLRGSVDCGDLPIEADKNDGAKIWLVLSSDYSTDEPGIQGHMVAWNPTEYLFENNLIDFDDTDD